MPNQTITFGIVEDEAIESETMQLFIENNFDEAQVLWRAEDGLSGLEAWKRQPVHILIIDIHMPVMDGLTLCRHLNGLGCDSVLVINTAYTDFSYAKQAIALRAFDYITKPADNAELRQTLSGCIQEAQRRLSILRRRTEQKLARESLGHLAVARMYSHPKEAVISKLYLEPMGWPQDRPYQTCVIHYLASAALDAERMHTLEASLQFFPDADWLSACDFVDGRHMIALVEPRQPIDPQHFYTLLWMYGKYYARRLSLLIHISHPCPDKEAVASECSMLPASSLSGKLEMPRRSWKVLRTAESEKLTRTLERFFTDGQFARVRRQLRELQAAYDDPALLWELLQWIFLAAQDVWPDQNILNFTEPIYRHRPVDADFCDTLIRSLEGLPSPDNGDVIDRALQIMKTEFGQDLSQSNLAGRLGLEQGYFSRLFKKRCGRNFSEALTDIRMQHAEKLLLSNPEMTLDELCMACGLSSKTYFSEVFKKWKGMTITQFLKSHEQ